jgi:hypothetical protein
MYESLLFTSCATWLNQLNNIQSTDHKAPVYVIFSIPWNPTLGSKCVLNSILEHPWPTFLPQCTCSKIILLCILISIFGYQTGRQMILHWIIANNIPPPPRVLNFFMNAILNISTLHCTKGFITYHYVMTLSFFPSV